MDRQIDRKREEEQEKEMKVGRITHQNEKILQVEAGGSRVFVLSGST